MKDKTNTTLQVFHHKQKINYYTKGFLYDKALFLSALDSIIFKVCPKLIKLYGPVDKDIDLKNSEPADLKF